jgi:hypothetical protein
MFVSIMDAYHAPYTTQDIMFNVFSTLHSLHEKRKLLVNDNTPSYSNLCSQVLHPEGV